MRAQGGRVIQRCQNKISQIGGCEWCHAPEVRRVIGEIWKSQLVELRTRHRTRRVDFRGLQRPDEFARYGRRTRWGADGKVIIERLCISLPYVKKPLNSTVIKSFVPERRSRKCFSCFGIPMLYVYMLWTFYVHFTRIRIMSIVHNYITVFKQMIDIE